MRGFPFSNSLRKKPYRTNRKAFPVDDGSELKQTNIKHIQITRVLQNAERYHLPAYHLPLIGYNPTTNWIYDSPEEAFVRDHLLLTVFVPLFFLRLVSFCFSYVRVCFERFEVVTKSWRIDKCGRKKSCFERVGDKFETSKC